MFGIIIKIVEVAYNFITIFFKLNTFNKKELPEVSIPIRQPVRKTSEIDDNTATFLSAIAIFSSTITIIYFYPHFTSVLFLLTLFFTLAKIYALQTYNVSNMFSKFFAIRSFIYSSFSLLVLVRPPHIQNYYEQMTGISASELSFTTIILWLIENIKVLFTLTWHNHLLLLFILFFSIFRIIILVNVAYDSICLLNKRLLAKREFQIEQHNVSQGIYLLFLIIIGLAISNYDFFVTLISSDLIPFSH